MNPTRPEMQTISRTDTFKLAGAAALILVALIAFYLFSGSSLLARIIVLLIAVTVAVALALKTEPGVEVFKFLQDARTELRKVVWPTRSETTQTTLIVIAMVVVMGILLWLLDVILFWLVRLVTG